MIIQVGQIYRHKLAKELEIEITHITQDKRINTKVVKTAPGLWHLGDPVYLTREEIWANFFNVDEEEEIIC